MGLLGKTDQVNQAFAMWVDFHGTVNPLIPLWVNQGKIGQDKVDFIAHLIEHGITVYYPTDNQHAPADIVRELNGGELACGTYRSTCVPGFLRPFITEGLIQVEDETKRPWSYLVDIKGVAAKLHVV